MALKARLETEQDLNALPEAVRKEYKKVEEGDTAYFVLDAEGVEDVTGLKSALNKERGGRTKMEKLAKRLGLRTTDDPEAANKELLEKLGDSTLEDLIEASTKAGATKTEADEAVKNAKKLARDLGTAQETVTTQSVFIDRLVRENALKDILAKPEHEGNWLFLGSHLMKQVKVVEEDGAEGKEYVAKVIDPKTKEVRTKKGSTTEMTLDDLVVEVKAIPEFADAFKGTGASGSGARPSTNPAGGGSRKRTTDTPQTKRQGSTVGYNQV